MRIKTTVSTVLSNMPKLRTILSLVRGQRHSMAKGPKRHKNNRLERNNIGVAVKDDSRVTMSQNLLEDNFVGLSVYRKYDLGKLI